MPRRARLLPARCIYGQIYKRVIIGDPRACASERERDGLIRGPGGNGRFFASVCAADLYPVRVVVGLVKFFRNRRPRINDVCECSGLEIN